MKNSCCVPHCDSKRSSVKLHRFPKTEIGLKWVTIIDCARLKELSSEDLRKWFVCHKHFEKRFVTGRHRLHMIAYPTLFTDEEMDTGIPAKTQEDSEKNQLRDDHDYTRKKKHFDHTYSKPIQNTLEEIELNQNIDCNSPSTSELDYKTCDNLTEPQILQTCDNLTEPQILQTCDNLTEPQILHQSDEFQSITELYESFGKMIKLIRSEKVEDLSNFELYENSENMIEHMKSAKDEELSTSVNYESSENMTEHMESATDEDHSMSDLDSSEYSTEYLDIATDEEQSMSELDESSEYLIEYLENTTDCTSPTNSELNHIICESLIETQILRPSDQNESTAPELNIGTSNKHNNEKRVEQKLNVLTPRHLNKKYFDLKKTKRNTKVSKEKYLEKLNKKLNFLSKKILYLQTQQHTKSKKVKIYPEDEKLIALSVMKQSQRVTKFCKEFLSHHQKAHK